MKKFYITMAIPYVNAHPHIGHSLLAVLTDIFARYKKQARYNVFFSTGTDEHGLKIKQSADKAKKAPLELADEVSKEFRKAWDLLNIDYSYFIRTTNGEHKRLSRRFLQNLYDKGHIYKDVYEGLYCVGCEKFLTDSDTNEQGFCPLHPPEQTIKQREENYFFKLSEFAHKVEELIRTDKFHIVPEERKKEILSRIGQGVEDISISREKLDWGVAVPWDESHTVYVWVEALLNYWTIPRILDKPHLWPPDLQTIGKDILWFHAVIWPALLIAGESKIPKRLFVHSFLQLSGRKMSKSLGNVITPQQLVESYEVDGARYLLAKSLPYADDRDVSLEKFDDWYNADLANGLGNLVSRTATLAEKAELYNKPSKRYEFYSEYSNLLESYRFDLAIQYIWEKKIAKLDKLIDIRRPWELDGKQLRDSLSDIVEEIPRIAYNLKPFMPNTAEKIFEQYSGEIKKSSALFPRV